MQISSLRPTKQVVVFDSLHSSVISPTHCQIDDAELAAVLPCSICHEHKSLYSCPRCRIPYCSVSCYQKHGIDGRLCTEQFYENRVTQILRLEVKEKSNHVRNKLHSELMSQSNEVTDECSDNIVESNRRSDGLDRDELLQVLSVLEKFEENACGITDNEIVLLNEQLKRNCSVKVQTVVRETMHEFADTCDSPKEDLGKTVEWILEPWKPWWRPDIQSVVRDTSCDSESVEDDGSEGNSQSEPDIIQTIDERVLALPSFDKLFRMKRCIDDSSNLDQFPKLQYNMVDILLGTVFTMRLYCGVNNILYQNLAMDAASSLISSSHVLLSDVRHLSLESVLFDCNNANHPTQKRLRNEKCHISWSFLVQDVAMVFQNFRFVMRALFEANDIVKAAILEIRSSIKSSENCNTNALTEQRDQLLRIHKKIQFYLSWCAAIRKACHGVWPLARMSSDILMWLEAWRLPTKDHGIR